MKAYISEVIGTGLFTLVVVLSAAAGPWGSAIFTVFTLIFLAYTIGHTSGAHVNPAITIGALAVQKISLKRAIGYIVAQFAGAALAVLFIKYADIATITANESVASGKLFLAEMVGVTIFAFGVASVLMGKNEKGSSGFIVGLSLFVGIIVSSFMLTGAAAPVAAILNPAAAFGVNALNWASVLGPIVGGIVGMALFVLLSDSSRQYIAHMQSMFKGLSSDTSTHSHNS